MRVLGRRLCNLHGNRRSQRNFGRALGGNHRRRRRRRSTRRLGRPQSLGRNRRPIVGNARISIATPTLVIATIWVRSAILSEMFPPPHFMHWFFKRRRSLSNIIDDNGLTTHVARRMLRDACCATHRPSLFIKVSVDECLCQSLRFAGNA